LAVLFLVFDGVIKVLKLAPVMESFALLGYPESVAAGIGVLLFACLVIYVMPRTSIFGAVLLTGYLGGAIASHVRIRSEPFSLIFPIMIDALLWVGFTCALRDCAPSCRCVGNLRQHGTLRLFGSDLPCRNGKAEPSVNIFFVRYRVKKSTAYL
jgi:hypothetical protein